GEAVARTGGLGGAILACTELYACQPRYTQPMNAARNTRAMRGNERTGLMCTEALLYLLKICLGRRYFFLSGAAFQPVRQLSAVSGHSYHQRPKKPKSRRWTCRPTRARTFV